LNDSALPLFGTKHRARAEDAIDHLIALWVTEASELRVDRRKAKEEKRRRAEKECLRQEREAELRRRRQELEERQEAEQVCVNRLLADATAWRQSILLREYIGRVEQVILARDGVIPMDSEAASWLAWARQQADRLDPFVPNPPSVLDERI
jgi:hypothetical protein